jgi:hypothetical protein
MTMRFVNAQEHDGRFWLILISEWFVENFVHLNLLDFECRALVYI